MQLVHTIEGKISVKRLLVGSLLALSALGLRYLPDHRQATEIEPNAARVNVEVEHSDDKAVTGPNSLFGAADTLNDHSKSLAKVEAIGHYQLDQDRSVNLAGMDSMLNELTLNPVVPVLNPPIASTGSIDLSGSAIPESRAAGLLLLGVAPALLLRRPRRVRR